MLILPIICIIVIISSSYRVIIIIVIISIIVFLIIIIPVIIVINIIVSLSVVSVHSSIHRPSISSAEGKESDKKVLKLTRKGYAITPSNECSVWHAPALLPSRADTLPSANGAAV